MSLGWGWPRLARGRRSGRRAGGVPLIGTRGPNCRGGDWAEVVRTDWTGSQGDRGLRFLILSSAKTMAFRFSSLQGGDADRTPAYGLTATGRPIRAAHRKRETA